MAKAGPFDAAEYLDSPEMIAAYLTEAFESDDASEIAIAIGAVARAVGMSAVAEKAGLSLRFTNARPLVGRETSGARFRI
jgi:probable addiction module antidote protein